MQWAAAAGNVATCRWLLSKGVDFSALNHVRHGALNKVRAHPACRLLCLLRLTPCGCCALGKAATKGHTEAVRWLLLDDEGPRLTAQLTLLDLEGRSVADLARLMGQHTIGEWLDELIAVQQQQPKQPPKQR